MLRQLRVKIPRFLPQSLSFCRRSGVGSFSRFGSPSTGTSLFSGWLNFPLRLLQLALQRLLKNRQLVLFPLALKWSHLQWLRTRYFLFHCFWSCFLFVFLLHVFGIPSSLFYVWPLSWRGFLSYARYIHFSACLYSSVVRYF